MKILITGAWRCSQSEIKAIETLGHTPIFMQQEKDELPCDASQIDGAICNGLFLYHDIDRFENLKYVQLTSAGFDRAPMEKISARNIKINNARGVYSIPMAEFALAGGSSRSRGRIPPGTGSRGRGTYFESVLSS